MESYSILAEYYDKLMGDFNYKEIALFIQNQNIGKNGLELGCGSGEITMMLAKSGYKMTACDLSNEMLDIASKKALKNALDIRFLCCDIVELDLDKKFDFIIAICDVFNYIEQKELKGVIDKLYDMLADNGVLIFDISSKYKLTEILGDNLYFEEHEEFSYFWQNELDETSGCVDMNLVFFVKDKDGKYIRKEENQTQYIHDRKDVENMLAKFSKVEVFDQNLAKPDKDSTRLFFKATK